jgi:anti-anti-sigma regulatory factor
MPTNITELVDEERGKTVLRIEGSLMRDDAVLIERIALDLREQGRKNITLDLADLDFLDSESAPILKRIEREHGFEIEGVEFFLQTIVNEAEKNHN